MNVSKVLLVEDDELTQILLKSYLEKEFFEMTVARDAARMSQLLKQHQFALIILDLGLPDEDGLVLIRQIRMASDVPILVITSRHDQADRNSALELGADDYMIKPFDPVELVLRLKNILRRTLGRTALPSQSPPASLLQIGRGWSLCLESYSLKGNGGTDQQLTRAEFNILAALARSPGKVLTRAQLLDATAHFGNDPYERTVDVLIGRVRRKLKSADSNLNAIKTVPGIGYMLTIS